MMTIKKHKAAGRAWYLVMLCCAVALLTRCGGREIKQFAPETFDLSTIPCGMLMGGTKPHMTILTANSNLVDITVPEWVWDVYAHRSGEMVGNCAQADPDAVEEPETAENAE